jgi:hypothetical protein
MAERLLKDEGWSLKAEVCPVLPPHFLLSPSPVSSSALNFQVSVFPPVLWSQSPSVPWSHFSFQVSAFIPQPLFCNQQSVGSRALLSGQRPGSYQPRATPWVHRAIVILSQAEGLVHTSPGQRPGFIAPWLFCLRPKAWLIPAQGNALGSSCHCYSVAGQRPAS